MLFVGNNYSRRPATDELEVSVFGAGFGEAIAVHLGDNSWIMVDSCDLSGTGKPAQLEYLIDIGASDARVQAIVASHWDDDHVRGFANLLRAHPDAAFILADVFCEKDFLAFAAEYDLPLTVKARGGVRELFAALKHCFETSRQPFYAGPSRRLISSDSYSHKAAVEVWTLSPSDIEKRNFLRWVAEQSQTVPSTRRLAIGRKRNDLSTVLFVRVGSDAMLFGGDLEGSKAGTGWTAILEDRGRPNHRAGVFKTAHHGSKSGDHPGIWEQLLVEHALAVLTPWALAGGKLPTKADIERIRGKTENGYSASFVRSTKPARRDRAVERTIKEGTLSFRVARHNPGVVRLRKKVGPEHTWRCELFGAAVHLSEYPARVAKNVAANA